MSGSWVIRSAAIGLLSSIPLLSAVAAGDANTAVGRSSSESTGDTKQTDKQKVSDKQVLEEVVVTAQKREERLQDVPISVSVLSGATLDASTVQGVADALNAVPGIATYQSFEGGGTQVIVRGVTASDVLYAGASPIAYYLDSVPYGLVRGAVGPDADAYDLDRVEVLRGPQGTLYGEGSLNGVVRVLTKDPDLENFDFKTRLSTSNTEGGSENYRSDAAVNLPLVDDKLALRAVVGWQKLSGWVDSPIKTGVNSGQLENYRIKLLAKPIDDLTISLYASASVNDFNAPSTSRPDGKISGLGGQPYYIDYQAYGGTVRYETSHVSISSTTSLLNFYNQGTLDLGPLLSGKDLPSTPVPFVSHNGTRTTSEELLVNSKDTQLWKWSAGFFYRDGKDTNYQYVAPLTIPLSDIWFHDKSNLYAIFGEVGQSLFNDKFEWTLGLRHFHDSVSTNGAYQLATATNPDLQSSYGYSSVNEPYTANTPRAVLTWKPAARLTTYVSYSEGFRSGWPQQPTIQPLVPDAEAVKPDRLRNYEVGAKGSLSDTFAFDASVYYMDWRDIQEVLGLLNNGTCCISLGVNGNNASGVGVDLALTARPIQGLELSVYGSWNNLSFNSAVYSDGIVEFDKGERPPLSPEYTIGGAATYNFPLQNGYSGQFTASNSYISYMTERTLVGPPFVAVLVKNDHLEMLRLNLKLIAPAHWTATAYVDNLTNWYGSRRRNYEPYDMPDWDDRPRPRTVGLQFGYSFR